MMLQGIDDPADVADLRHLGTELVDFPLQRGALQVQRSAARGMDDEDDARVRVVAERVAEQAAALLALRSGVGETGRLEVVLDVVAEGDRDQEKDADGGEDELGTGPGEVRDPVHGRDCTRIQSIRFGFQIALLSLSYDSTR